MDYRLTDEDKERVKLLIEVGLIQIDMRDRGSSGGGAGGGGY